MSSRHPESVIGVLFFSIISAFSEAFGQDPVVVRSTLEAVRHTSPDTFTLEVEVDRPVGALLRRQGSASYVVRITAAKDTIAIVWKASGLPRPKYYPPDTPGYQGIDYDANGNLIVSMWSEGAAFRDQTVNEEYSEDFGFRVAPDGTTKRRQGPGAPLLSRYQASNSNTQMINLVRRILWALGRPWADGVTTLVNEAAGPDGTKRLRAVGDWAPSSGTGLCELLAEPGNGYLVRQASFGGEGEPPRAESKSEGVRRFGEATLAERGEFILPRLETVTVRLVSFSPTFDPQLSGEAQEVISRARTSLVQVMDYRDDPTHPKVGLVQPGDLDKDE